MREAGGFRMGPFELMDLIGHDVNFAVTKVVWDAFFHDPRFTPSLHQQELVNAGYLGRKSGRGFYDYARAPTRPHRTEAAQTAPGRVSRARRSRPGGGTRRSLRSAGRRGAASPRARRISGGSHRRGRHVARPVPTAAPRRNARSRPAYADTGAVRPRARLRMPRHGSPWPRGQCSVARRTPPPSACCRPRARRLPRRRRRRACR